MASLQELWEKVTGIYDYETFCLYLELLLDRNEILKIVSSLGLSYPGRRLSSIPTQELIDALVLEFYENPEMGKEAIKIFKRMVAPYGEKIAQLTPKEVKTYLKSELTKGMSLKEEMKLGFALILDDRKEMIKEYEWFWGKLAKQKPKNVVDQKDFMEQINKLERMLREKEDINRKLNEAMLLSKEENKKLQREINELKKVNADLQSEIAQLSSPKQEPIGISEMKHIEKNLEKILYLLEKFTHGENRILAIPERLEATILTLIDEVKKNFEEARLNEERMFSGLRQSIFEELKKYSLPPKIPTKEEAKKTSLERVALFADAENLYHSARECFNGKISYEKLLALIKGEGRYLVKAYAYVVRGLDRDPTLFITSLEKLGFEVKVKEPKYRSDGSAKANWDMGIALDILNLLDKIDTIILASGDGDFVPLVNYIKRRGKRVEVFSFPKNTAYDLMDVADKFYPLDEKIAWI